MMSNEVNIRGEGFMRKISIILAAAMAIASLVGCASKTTETSEAVTSAEVTIETETEVETADEPFVDETDTQSEAVVVEEAEDTPPGGWEKPGSPVLTEEVKTYFAEAFPDEANTFYEPEALLGTQVVSGTNYKILYRKIYIGEDGASDTYGIATIYVDLNKSVEVLDAGETDIPTHLNEGGWTTFEVANLTDDERNAFNAVFEGMTGVSYEPVAVIAESDTGYFVLYEAKVVYPGTEPYYAVIELKKKTTGELEIGTISDLIVEN